MDAAPVMLRRFVLVCAVCLGIAVGAGCVILMNVVVNKVFHDDRYYEAHGWPKLAALWIAAVLTWFVCQYLDDENDDDLRIGGRVIFRHVDNTFFLIPIRYWPILFIVLGIVFSFIHDK
jgi:hypothetical protein